MLGRRGSRLTPPRVFSKVLEQGLPLFGRPWSWGDRPRGFQSFTNISFPTEQAFLFCVAKCRWDRSSSWSLSQTCED